MLYSVECCTCAPAQARMVPVSGRASRSLAWTRSRRSLAPTQSIYKLKHQPCVDRSIARRRSRKGLRPKLLRAPVRSGQVDASLGQPCVALVLAGQTLVDILASPSAQGILVPGRAGRQSGQTLEATLPVDAVLMQVEPTVVQTFRALVGVQAGAVEASSEAVIAGRYRLADEGSVCVDASAPNMKLADIFINRNL